MSTLLRILDKAAAYPDHAGELYTRLSWAGDWQTAAQAGDLPGYIHGNAESVAFFDLRLLACFRLVETRRSDRRETRPGFPRDDVPEFRRSLVGEALYLQYRAEDGTEHDRERLARFREEHGDRIAPPTFPDLYLAPWGAAYLDAPAHV